VDQGVPDAAQAMLRVLPGLVVRKGRDRRRRPSPTAVAAAARRDPASTRRELPD
jgi:hypothetical protein